VPAADLRRELMTEENLMKAATRINELGSKLKAMGAMSTRLTPGSIAIAELASNTRDDWYSGFDGANVRAALSIAIQQGLAGLIGKTRGEMTDLAASMSEEAVSLE
jgi:hypothetical protein